jgi:ribosome-associated protein
VSAAIQINDRITIDPSELKVQFVRSPGPGGQNVNKVNSKAIIHWDLKQHTQIPSEALQRLRLLAGNRINQDDCLVVSSHQSRNQAENLAFCHAKIRQIVLQALPTPTVRRPTKVTRASKQRRLQAKRQLSEKKAGRKRSDWTRD